MLVELRRRNAGTCKTRLAPNTEGYRNYCIDFNCRTIGTALFTSQTNRLKLKGVLVLRYIALTSSCNFTVSVVLLLNDLRVFQTLANATECHYNLIYTLNT